MSREMMERTLLAFPSRWFRKLVSVDSETKLFASLAKWLAGRACMPADKGQLNTNCSAALLRSGDMSVLELSEDAFRILESFLKRHLNNVHAIKALAFLDFDIDGENCDLGLANVAVGKFV